MPRGAEQHHRDRLSRPVLVAELEAPARQVRVEDPDTLVQAVRVAAGAPPAEGSARRAARRPRGDARRLGRDLASVPRYLVAATAAAVAAARADPDGATAALTPVRRATRRSGQGRGSGRRRAAVGRLGDFGTEQSDDSALRDTAVLLLPRTLLGGPPRRVEEGRDRDPILFRVRWDRRLIAERDVSRKSAASASALAGTADVPPVRSVGDP